MGLCHAFRQKRESGQSKLTMSHITLLNSCPNIQAELTDYFQKCPTTEQFPFFEFITSPINESGLSMAVSPKSGKIKTMELRYTQRLLENVVAEDQPNPNCTATNQVGDFVEEYTIDPDDNIQYGEKYDAADLERICRDNSTFFVERLNAIVDVLDRKLATKHTTDAVALTGKWASDVSVTDDRLIVNTLKAGSTDINPLAMQVINRALQKTGYCDTPLIFGGDTLVDYYEAMLAGCCSNQGIDLSEILARYGKAVMYDRRVASAFGGSDYNIVLQPKALVLLKYTRSGWKEGVPAPLINGGNYFATTIISPRTGVPMDLNVKDDCGTVHITVTATTKLVGMPNDMFHAGDVYEGVNFFNEIKVTNT